MVAMPRFGTIGLCLMAALAVTEAAAAAEGLPMPVKHYGELCQHSGGSITVDTNGAGPFMTQCSWPDQGRTECKVTADEVSVCAIRCESPACLKANPDHLNPSWPLAGGPGAPAQTQAN